MPGASRTWSAPSPPPPPTPSAPGGWACTGLGTTLGTAVTRVLTGEFAPQPPQRALAAAQEGQVALDEGPR